MDDKKLEDEELQQQEQQRPLDSDSGTEILGKEKNPKWDLTSFVLQPIYWFRKLNRDLHWSFLLSILIVYGISQGLGTGLSRVSTQYYMKDELKLQPSQAQAYSGIIGIPWVIKPLWGLLTDTLPIATYRRKPYFVLAGFLSTISMLALSLNSKVSIALALFSLVIAGAGVAIADVTVDACVTENSVRHPSLAGDMQSLCGLSSSVGALVGFTLSGIFVHLIGPKGVFGILCIPAGLVIFSGMVLRENRIHNFSHGQVSEKFVGAAKAMWTTMSYKDVWRPCLYMYLSLAFNLNIRKGIFYWYTDAEDGPKFSQEVVGSIFSFGAIGSLLGVLVYQNFFKNYNFRSTLFWVELMFGASGLLDLVLVLRINLRFGMPDYFFVVFDDAASQLIGRIKWMPLLVLSSKLCPPGIEGTSFALLMSVDHVGMLSSAWTGGFTLHILKVTRSQFDNLWVAILLRSILRITPICFLFLIPKSDPNTNILPSELLQAEKGHSGDLPESENMEMAALISSI